MLHTLWLHGCDKMQTLQVLLWTVPWGGDCMCVSDKMTLLQASVKALIRSQSCNTVMANLQKPTCMHAAGRYCDTLHGQCSDARIEGWVSALTIEHAFKLSTHPLSAHLPGECFSYLQHKDNPTCKQRQQMWSNKADATHCMLQQRLHAINRAMHACDYRKGRD